MDRQLETQLWMLRAIAVAFVFMSIWFSTEVRSLRKDRDATVKALDSEIRSNNFLKAQNEGMLKELSEMYTAHAKALTARKEN